MAGSSQTELLSRVAVAEAELEELVLSTLAAFFAIASVEWLRDEARTEAIADIGKAYLYAMVFDDISVTLFTQEMESNYLNGFIFLVGSVVPFSDRDRADSIQVRPPASESAESKL